MNRARIEEVAQGMLERYSSPKVAAEMAGFHATDHAYESEQWQFWMAVQRRIRELAAARRDPARRDHLRVPRGGHVEYRSMFMTSKGDWIDDGTFNNVATASRRADMLIRMGARRARVEERAYDQHSKLVKRAIVYRARRNPRRFTIGS